MDVRTILATKGTDVETIRPDATVLMAAEALRRKGIGAVVVSADGLTIDGIISERDVVVGLAEKGELLLHARVADFMTRRVVTCRADDSIDHVLATMTRHRHRHLPVVDADGHLAGIVSIGDLVKHRLDEAELERAVVRDVTIARR